MKQTLQKSQYETRNKYCFGLGTIGRDMFYSFESNALLYFLSNVLDLPLSVFAIASVLLSVLRIIDALNDPITGLIIDNIRTPWGKYKPAIVFGGVLSAVFYVMLFANIGTGTTFLIVFAIAYILWDISYGINDIAYWTLLPALTSNQTLREKYGAFARICANIGMYITIVAWEPLTRGLGKTLGDGPKAWLLIACGICVIYLGFQCFTIFGVKENKRFEEKEEKTTLRQMWSILTKNDQLMWTALSMGLFMVGYCTTTGIGIYYMEYVFGDKGMYAVLAAVCGLSQFAALIAFPYVSKKFNRQQLYGISTLLVVIGGVIFFFAEISLIVMVIAAVTIFVGQAFIQMLMLMFLTDTIEYGQWKTGKRNESITFSIQPVVYKIGGALSTGLISLAIILAGIKTDGTTAVVLGTGGKLIIKCAMLVIPLILIGIGYVIYRKKFKISEEFYAKMISDLEERGEMKSE